MITLAPQKISSTADTPTGTAKRAPAPRSSAAQKLRDRTRQVLSTEIAFIPNRRFCELDLDRKWHQSLTMDVASQADVKVASRLGMPSHLERLCATPLLTPDQETELFVSMNYLKYRANLIRSTLRESHPSKKKLADIESFLAESIDVRNRIVQANTRLVISIVKSFTDEHNSFDDLLSEGIGCLIKAVEKFDVDRGFRFSTYATSAVRREVIRLIRRRHRDRARFVSGSEDCLSSQVMPELDGPERTEKSLRKINRSVAKIVKNLDDREQFIVRARYGFIDVGGKPTFSRLGEHLGVSKERVRQLESRAMRKLRDAIGEFQMQDLGELV